MATYYVNNSTGSDSNTATQAQSMSTPWASVAHITSLMTSGGTFHAGDNILFAAGQTFTGGTELYVANLTSSATNPLIVGRYGTGANPVIQGSTTNGALVYDVNGVWIMNVNFTGSGAYSGTGGGINVYADGGNTYKSISVINSVISGYNFGIGIGSGAASSGFNGVNVSGCNLSGNNVSGFWSYSYSGYTFSGSNYLHSNINVIDTVAYNNPGTIGTTSTWTGSGIVVSACNTALVQFCTAYGNGADCGGNPDGPAGIWAYESTGVEILNCVSYSNLSGTTYDGDGFDLDIDCSSCIIAYCLAYNNAGAGILLDGVSNAYHTSNVVTNNICWGNCQNTIHTTAGYAELMIYGGTTFTDQMINNTLVASAGPAYSGPCVAIYGTCTGHAFWNNILYADTGGHILTGSTYTTSSVIFQGNNYYASGGVSIDWNGTTYTSITAWQAAVTGQEKNGSVNYGIRSVATANPQLNAPTTMPTVTSPYTLTGALGLALQSVSAVGTAGLDVFTLFSSLLSSDTSDYFGNPTGAPYPIGASMSVPATSMLSGVRGQAVRGGMVRGYGTQYSSLNATITATSAVSATVSKSLSAAITATSAIAATNAESMQLSATITAYELLGNQLPMSVDASTPAVAWSATDTVTSASFTPPANSLVVAALVVGCKDQATDVNVTPSDSLSGSWTLLLDGFLSGLGIGRSKVYAQSAGPNPSARTVTLTGTGTPNTNAEGCMLVVLVLDNAAPLVAQPGASAWPSPQGWDPNLTPHKAGSYVIVAGWDIAQSITYSLPPYPNSTSLALIQDTTNNETYAAFLSHLTTQLLATSFGSPELNVNENSASLGLEILAAAGNSEAVALTASISGTSALAVTDTESDALTAAITATSSVAATLGGTTPVTASITATSALAATNAEVVALGAPVSGSSAIAATNTEAVALGAAVSGTSSVAATNAEKVALGASVSSTSAISATNAEAVALTAAVTATSSVSASLNGTTPVTAAITAAAAVAGTSTEAVALTSVIAATSTVAGTNAETAALGSAIASSLTTSATNAEVVALGTPILGSLAVSAANAEAVALGSALNETSVVAGAVTAAVAATDAITATLSLSATSTEAVALTASISATSVVAANITSTSGGQITGAISSTSSVSAADSVTLPITAAITATSAAAGATTEAVAVTAALSATSAATAANAENVALGVGVTAASSLPAATNTEAVALTSAVNDSAVVAAANAETVACAAAISTTSATAANSTESVALTATVTSVSALAANNSGTTPITASITATSAATSNASEAIALSGAVTATSSVAGAVTRIIGLSSSLSASSSVNASASVAYSLVAAVTSSVVVSTALNIHVNEVVSITSTGSVSGNVAVSGNFIAGNVTLTDFAANKVTLVDFAATS